MPCLSNSSCVSNVLLKELVINFFDMQRSEVPFCQVINHCERFWD